MAHDRILGQNRFPAVLNPSLPPLAEFIHYPDSDGRFLPEHPIEAQAVLNLRVSFQFHFHRVANVVMEGGMFIYYEEGNPKKYIAPDIYVVLHHDLGNRMVYKLWEEGKPPDFALEVVSPSVRTGDEVEKVALHERLGVGEYFRFQPIQEKQESRLVGYRLRGGRYREVEAEPRGGLCSTRVGVEMRIEGTSLRVRNAVTGLEYPWLDELPRITRAAEARAKAEAEASQRSGT